MSLLGKQDKEIRMYEATKSGDIVFNNVSPP